MEYQRTPFTGWEQPQKSEAQLLAEAIERADAARIFLDNDIIIRAYQKLLDGVVDELLLVPNADSARVLAVHARAQGLMSLVMQLKVYMNEPEVIEADRKKRIRDTENRKPSH
jgi:hypothetical protein